MGEYNVNVWQEQSHHFYEPPVAREVVGPHRRKLLDWIKEQNPTSILDVGCCDGRLVPWLKSMGWTGNYLGVDVTPNFIDKAKAENSVSGSISFKVMDARDMSELEDQSFDMVICNMVICHMDKESVTKCLDECRRISKHLIAVFTFESEGEVSYDMNMGPNATWINMRLIKPDFLDLFPNTPIDLFDGTDGGSMLVIGGLFSQPTS